MSSEKKEPTSQPAPPAGQEQPIVARLVDPTAEPGMTSEHASAAAHSANAELAQPAEQDRDRIRVGSPFAIDPARIAGTTIQRRRAQPEAFYDVGPLRYTAMGAVAAAILVLGFAAAAAYWFPGGGTIIAALGCALSIFGLYSNKKFAAGGCLALHLLLFMICYSRAIDV